MKEYSEITPTEPSLSREGVFRIITSRRSTEPRLKDNIQSIEVKGSPVKIHAFLGSGGSKEVYDIEQDDGHFALAVCGTQDHPDIVIEKWKKVLCEPQNTKLLRDKGFFVNKYSQIIPIKINDLDFPGLLMARYEDHDFKIFDSKNSNDNDNVLVGAESDQSDQKTLKRFSFVAQEIVALINGGIRLGRDSFNLCISRGEIHLYFNDLGSMSVGEISHKNISQYIRYYSVWAIEAFVNSFGYKSFMKSSYLKGICDIDSSFQLELEKEIAKLCQNQKGTTIV